MEIDTSKFKDILPVRSNNGTPFCSISKKQVLYLNKALMEKIGISDNKDNNIRIMRDGDSVLIKKKDDGRFKVNLKTNGSGAINFFSVLKTMCLGVKEKVLLEILEISDGYVIINLSSAKEIKFLFCVEDAP